jgi:hypothetical protein
MVNVPIEDQFTLTSGTRSMEFRLILNKNNKQKRNCGFADGRIAYVDWTYNVGKSILKDDINTIC